MTLYPQSQRPADVFILYVQVRSPLLDVERLERQLIRQKKLLLLTINRAIFGENFQNFGNQ